MKSKSLVNLFAKGFVAVSALSLFYVSILAFLNPQQLMDLVHVRLDNNDAYSSIRGVYGGVGLSIVISLAYLLVRDLSKALLYLCFLWGLYAFSRVITIVVEGALGNFGKQWLLIETVFFCIAFILLFLYKRYPAGHE